MKIYIATLMLIISSHSVAGESLNHCSKNTYKGVGYNQKSAIMVWRANVISDAGDFNIKDLIGKSDDIWWRYAKNKKYKRGKKLGVPYVIVKAKPCSAIKE